MTPDYFDAQKTGGSKDSIEITMVVKSDKVMAFVDEIRQATLDQVLEIIDDIRFAIPVCQNSALAGYNTAIRQVELRVLALRGEQDDSRKDNYNHAGNRR